MDGKDYVLHLDLIEKELKKTKKKNQI